MRKLIFLGIYIAIIFSPFVAVYSNFGDSLVIFIGYLYYYKPLIFIGEPFFSYSSDIGMMGPTIYGMALTAIIYTAIYWMLIAIVLKLYFSRSVGYR